MSFFRNRFNSYINSFLIIFILLLPINSHAGKEDSGPSLGAMVGDLVFARPLLFAVTAVGTALYVVTLPATLLTGNAGDAGEMLVLTPAEATFTRCLGCTNKDSYESLYDDDEFTFYEDKKKIPSFYLKGGYQASTYFGQEEGSGFNLSLGGNLFKNDYAFIDLEINYHNFGESGEKLAYEDGSTSEYKEVLSALGIGTNVGLNIGEYAQLYAKAGRTNWSIESESTDHEPEEGTFTSTSSLDGQDFYYGAGLGLKITDNLNLHLEYLQMSLSKIDFGDNDGELENKITSIGGGLALKF